ncbi:MAG: amidase, partial [Hyphomonadaceae bacterium]
AKGFGAEVQRRLLIGTYVLSAGYYDAYYLRAQKVRTRILQDFEEAFKQCDALLTPATPSAAFGYGEKGDDPVAMYLNDIFTVTANLAGLPALALPAGIDAQGLPLGLQVIGKALDEDSCFKVAAAIEDAAAFKARPAKWW